MALFPKKTLKIQDVSSSPEVKAGETFVHPELGEVTSAGTMHGKAMFEEATTGDLVALPEKEIAELTPAPKKVVPSMPPRPKIEIPVAPEPTESSESEETAVSAPEPVATTTKKPRAPRATKAKVSEPEGIAPAEPWQDALERKDPPDTTFWVPKGSADRITPKDGFSTEYKQKPASEPWITLPVATSAKRPVLLVGAGAELNEVLASVMKQLSAENGVEDIRLVHTSHELSYGKWKVAFARKVVAHLGTLNIAPVVTAMKSELFDAVIDDLAPLFFIYKVG